MGEVVSSRQVRSYEHPHLKLSIFENVVQHGDGDPSVYFDVVLYRRVRDKNTGKFFWKRGPNYKPNDIDHLIGLLTDASRYLNPNGGGVENHLESKGGGGGNDDTGGA